MHERKYQPNYRIYLLTIWQERGQDQPLSPQWRLHLTDPHTGQRYRVTHLDDLLVVLQQLHNLHTEQEMFEALQDFTEHDYDSELLL